MVKSTKLTVARRTFGGFAIVLVLLCGLAAFSTARIGAVETLVASLGQAADATAEIGETKAQIRQVALLVQTFVTTRTLADIELARTGLRQLKTSLTDMLTRYDGLSEVATARSGMLSALASAEQAFESETKAVSDRSVALRDFDQTGTTFGGTADALASALPASADPQLVRAASQFSTAVLYSRLATTRFAVSGYSPDADVALQELEKLTGLIGAIGQIEAPTPRTRKFVAALVEGFPSYAQRLPVILAASVKLEQSTKAVFPAFAALDAVSTKLVADVATSRAESMTRSLATMAAIRWSIVAAGGGVVLVGVLIAWGIGASIARPIRRMTDAMRELAAGRLDVEVPARGRPDEIGDMAEAVQVFRDNMARAETLAAEATIAAEERMALGRRVEAERAAATAEQGIVVEQLAGGLGRLAEGDLTVTLETAFPAGYESLRVDFNGAADRLHTAMRQIVSGTELIRSGTDEISHAADDLSHRTEQQAASLEETAAALDEITATVRKTAEGATVAQGVASASKQDAEHSSQVVRDAIGAMDKIKQSANQIGQIIGVIDEIAFQTNLLALNAGIEAARAGDAGRGFAVVASEVRALAQRSTTAAREIKTLIFDSNELVEQGVGLVDDTGQSLGRIVGQVDRLHGAISEIAAAAQEQANGLREVNTAINQMDQVTQQNAAMVEQSTAATHALAHETAELKRLTSCFQVETDTAADEVDDVPQRRRA